MLFDGKITLDRLKDTGFLKRLAPKLHIEDEAFCKNVTRVPLSFEELEDRQARLKREGYFEVDAAFQRFDVAAMADLVRNLAHQELPTVLAFLYDEFWAIYTALDPLLKPALGGDYARLPDFWCWHVDPRKEEAGWGPHRDKGAGAMFPDWSPKSVTAWIPLTDATPLNGCMYIVPADRDPHFRNPNNMQMPHAFKLQDIRALPAKAGTMFVWDQNVIHWGAHATARAGEPRISIALEFQSKATPAMNSPLMRADECPSLKMRRKLIAKQMLQYKHMYALAPEFERWAKAA